MKKHIKKITLGSALTSAAIITTTSTVAFAINASNEKSLSQNNNISSYISIYAQQAGPKTTFTKTVIQPTTTTTNDGEVNYTLTNFDPKKMDISLAPGSNGTLGGYNPATKMIEVLELSNGQHAQIQVTPKSGQTWTDGTNTAQKSSKFTPAQTRVGQKRTFTKVEKQPSTKTSTDGEVAYTLTKFDPNTMNISLAQGSNGTLGAYDPATKKVKVTGLKVGQHAQILVSMKTDVTILGLGVQDNYVGAGVKQLYTKDSTNTNGKYGKPAITESAKFTANKNSLVNFDFTLKGWATTQTKPMYNDIMNQGQYSKHVHGYLAFDKNLQKWTYNGKNAEGKNNTQAIFYLTTYDNLKGVYHPRARIWVESYDPATSKMSIKYDLDNFYEQNLEGGSWSNGNDNSAISDVKILSSQKPMQYWQDGTLTNQTSSKFTPAQTYAGLKKNLGSTYKVKQPTTTTSAGGEVTFTLTNFDPNTMDISLVAGSNGTLGTYDTTHKTVKVTGLSNGQHAQIQFSPKTGQKWADGTTTALLSWTFIPAQTYVGLQKTTFTKTVKQPTTKTSTDGEATYTLANFDPNKMVIALAPGAKGTLGKYDQKTKQIKITGLANGEFTQIQVTLKNKVDTWTDGTKTAQKSPKSTASTVITKPTFTKAVKQPTTKTSTDGEVTYTLVNFDPNKMVIALAPGAKGTLGKYDPITKQIKITGLANGEFTQIQFTLKNQGDTWTDGTTTAQKSPKSIASTVITKPTFTKAVKQPTTKTSTDGEVTYTLVNFDPNKMVIALAPGAKGTLGKYDPITKQIKITGLANGEFTQIQFALKNQGDTWTDGTTTAIVDKPTAIVYTNVSLVLIIPLSVLGALIIMFLIYSQRFYFSFKTMQKVTALNLRMFKTRIRLLCLKFTNALFKSK